MRFGEGYRPCTRTARVFDFPPEVPVIRFLDTVGFDDVGYDPREDLAELERHAHVVLAVARAMDPQQESLLAVLRAVRQRHPDWPLVLAQTALHDGFPDGADHPTPQGLATAPAFEDLRRSLASQAKRFADLPGTGEVLAVPVDFTRPEDGYTERHYGLEALLDALERAGSEGMATGLRMLATRRSSASAERARPHILGYAIAAGVTDAVPLVGFVTVPTIQGKLLHSIAGIYGLTWDTRTIREFAASLGTGTVLGIGLSLSLRQLAKLIPVYGQTLGAAAAGASGFAVTYALGWAACHYLGTVRAGHGGTEGVSGVYRKSLQEAFSMVRRRRDSHGKGAGAGAFVPRPDQ